MIQNVYLTCEALRLGYCAIGGFCDAYINNLFHFDQNKERMLYLGVLGAT
jgi:nitroreductase